MKKIQPLADGSAYIGRLPKGCIYCGTGEKLVLLITGRCKRRCFYCPLSFAKRGKSVIYADEQKVETLEEILGEAQAISANGTGITGGDPMVVPEITLNALRLLKQTFGPKHHIHLYTGGDFEYKYINKLAEAGLDELRFHPTPVTWAKRNKRMEKMFELAKENGISVGAELPLLPEYHAQLLTFAKYIDACGAEFLNLNELEFSESNWERCKAHGYMQKSNISNAVKSSEDLGLKILNELAIMGELELNVHYCSALFKNRQQLRNRLMRRGKNVIRPYQVLTDDATFLLGVIEPEHIGDAKQLELLQKQFVEKYDVPDELMKLNHDLKRLEIASWVLEKLKDTFNSSLRSRCFIIEEYPTADRLEVERIPLDEFK